MKPNRALMQWLLSTPLLLTSLLFAQPQISKPAKPVMPPMSVEEATRLLGEPTRVTLHLKDVSPYDLVKELSKQSGVAIQLQMWDEEKANKPVTIDLDNQPFWIAISAVCAKLNVAPESRAGRASLILHHSTASWPQANLMPLSPHVTLRLSYITDTHTITLQSDGQTAGGVKPVTDTHKIDLRSMFLFDPKIRLVQDDMQITIIEARDDNGVAVFDPEQKPFINGDSPLMWSVQIPLQRRATTGKQVVRLRARGQATVVTRQEVWEVPNVLNTQKVSKTVKAPGGEATYTFLGVEKIGNQYQVSIQVTRPPALVTLSREEEYRQVHRLNRDLVRMTSLRDTEGRSYEWRGSRGPDDDGLITINFIPGQEGQKPGVPEKLILPIILEVRELEIPFELNGLPLP